MATRQIFVFGSNRQGRHGKGAALIAKLNHGAVYGQAEGLQGDSYAIITKELRRGQPRVSLIEVGAGIKKFLEFAANHPNWDFNVSAIGCGLAGFEPRQIAPAFSNCPENVKLPEQFRHVLAQEV